MIQTGYTDYQQKIAQDGRQQTVQANVTLRDGFKYAFKSADIMESGLSFSDGTSESGNLSVGSFIGKCLTLKLYNFDGHLVETQFDAALIDMQVGLVVDASTTEWVYLGTFGVGEHSESGGIITLTAYDDSVKFDKKYDSTLSYPASLFDIVKDACTKCGVERYSTNFTNMNYVVDKRPDDDSITYADIVSYAAQLAGCWARINTSRQLIFGWYDMDRFYPDTGNVLDGGNFTSTPADTVDGGNFTNYNIDTIFGGVFRQNLDPPAEIESLSSCNLQTEDIRVTGVKLVPTDSKKPTLLKGTNDYVITIDKNPLAQGYLGSLLWNLAKRLVDFQFRPMEVSAWDNPSIEAGDVAYLTDPKGNRYRTIISNLDYEFGDYEKFSADAKSKADNDAERYSTSEKAASALNMRKNSDYIISGQISGDAAVQSVNDWNKYLMNEYVDALVKPRVGLIAQSRIAPRGPNATIEGEKNSAPGEAAHAEGSSNISPGKYSHTEGEGSSAPGEAAHAENSSLASGLCSHSENMGIASGPYSSAKGMGIASGPFSEASGGVDSLIDSTYDETPYESFGWDDVHIPKKRYAPEASGAGARAHGIATLASGLLSEADGRWSVASAEYAYASGWNNIASAYCAVARGDNCTAKGKCSYAGGCGSEAADYACAFGYWARAKEESSCAIGDGPESDGYASCSFGGDTVAHDAYEFVIGSCNRPSTGDSTNFSATNNAFVIGNYDRRYSAVSNCFRINFSGNAYGTGAYNTSGADYAEYFEWEDENPDRQDRVGRFVTLDGAKIRFAKPDDDVLGIVSGCPSVIGDADSESWNGRYARDIFGRPILETVNVPETQEKDKNGKVIRTMPAHTETQFKVNPDYDPAKEMDYVPREKRPEWSAVGMIGKVVLIDDGSCQPGGYCEPAADGSGIGTAAAKRNNCRVMERLDDSHIRVCLK